MKVVPVVDRLYRVDLGMVNAYILDEKELTLIDSGIPGSAEKILEALGHLGRSSEDLKHIILTHLHMDHTGGAAELKARTGATVHMHRLDAGMLAEGRAAREMDPAPGILSKLATKLFISRAPTEVEACETDNYLEEGELLDFAGGMEVLHVPGHAEGQVAFRWPGNEGVLIAADAAANIIGLGYPIVVEDLEVTTRSLKRLARLEFEHACFGHGKPIVCGAAKAFRKRFLNSRE
jgi:glyoxylase-like metal-dependent hydrolase (beta-lactamase superfamily II)